MAVVPTQPTVERFSISVLTLALLMQLLGGCTEGGDQSTPGRDSEVAKSDEGDDDTNAIGQKRTLTDWYSSRSGLSS